MSEDQRLTTISVFFNIAEHDGEFLSRFGFGNGLLQHLAKNNILKLSNTIDISEIVEPDSDFIIYLGTDTTPPCRDTIWIIAMDTMDISEK